MKKIAALAPLVASVIMSCTSTSANDCVGCTTSGGSVIVTSAIGDEPIRAAQQAFSAAMNRGASEPDARKAATAAAVNAKGGPLTPEEQQAIQSLKR